MTITDKIENLKTGYDMSYRNKYTKWVAAMFAAVLMFLPGCIKESPVDDYLPAGSTVLRISTKGIVVNPGDENVDWEVYVKTLRLIGFQEGKVVFNEKITDFSQYNQVENSFIEIPLNEPDIHIKRGMLDLYAVGNEEAAWAVENNPFSNIEQDVLNKISVTAKDKYLAPKADNPFLMSAHVNTTLVAQENEIDIKLVRTVGKVMLESVKMDDGTPLNGYTYTLGASGSVYANYPLFEGTNTASGNLITLDNVSSKDEPLYLSESAENSVTITVTVTTSDGKIYTNKETISATIIRNNRIDINATIKKDETSCLQLDISVVEWEAVPLNPSYE